MIQQIKPNIIRVSRHRSFKNKKDRSIKKRRSNTIIHVTLGLSRDIRSTNTKNNLSQKFSDNANNHSYRRKQIKSLFVLNPIQSEDGYHHSLSQTKKGNNITKTGQDSNVDTSSKINNHLLKSSKISPHEDVSIGHSCLNEKGMTEDYHRKQNNKKTKCLRRCAIISFLATLLVVLITAAILLALLIKPKSTTTTRTDIPVLRWNSTGVTVAGVVNSSGNTSYQLNYPIGVIVDYANNLYIADYNNHRIQKYLFGASSGQTVAGNGTAGSSQYQLYFPVRVIVDSNENLYISDTGNERIQYWTKGAVSGTTIAGTGVYGNSTNQFYFPYGIALNPTSSVLYIADSNNHRLMSYVIGINSGTLVFGGNGGGKNNTQLYNPIGLYFDSFANNLVICNYAAHNIVRYVVGDSVWTLIAGDINGNPGSTPSTLSGPLDVTFDPMGNMYVADRNNQRIQFFYNGQVNGTTIAGITNVVGMNATTFNSPWSLTLDSQLNLYVADFNNHRIQKFLRY